MFRTLRQRSWEQIDAKLIDRKLHKDVVSHSENTGRLHYQINDYMVEFPGLDGKPTRLVIREKGFEIGKPHIGTTVKIFVNDDRSKAIFVRKDQRAADKRRKEDQKAKQRKAEERFKRKLEE